MNQELLMTKFIEDLMRFPGCHLRCPMPIWKGESPPEWLAIKMDICQRTSDVLTMMGIEHTLDTLNYSIMIGLPP